MELVHYARYAVECIPSDNERVRANVTYFILKVTCPICIQKALSSNAVHNPPKQQEEKPTPTTQLGTGWRSKPPLL